MATQEEQDAQAIAEEIADYRAGELPRPTQQHVQRWVEQFDASEQVLVLSETRRLLSRTYVTKENLREWLRMLFRHEALVGKSPAQWVRSANFLRLQGAPSSQHDILILADEIVREVAGVGIDQCGSPRGPFLYFDDCIFTGWTVLRELRGWLTSAPSGTKLHVITAGMYTSGSYNAAKNLRPLAASKGVDLSFWRSAELPSYLDDESKAQVLRPAVIPPDPAVQAYFKSLAPRGQRLRQPGLYGQDDLFSSEQARQALESAFLKAGVRIINSSKAPSQSMRPLGYMNLDCLGFGATLITYRNAPNNAPLALWWGNPHAPSWHPFSKWYPLVQRKSGDE